MEKLFDEVIFIHDEVMPKMGDIHQAKKKLKNHIKSNPNSQHKAACDIIIKDLTYADDEMMDWMAEFKKPKKDTPEVDAIAYLAAEKQKIIKIQLDTERVIKHAEELIETIRK